MKYLLEYFYEKYLNKIEKMIEAQCYVLFVVYLNDDVIDSLVYFECTMRFNCHINLVVCNPDCKNNGICTDQNKCACPSGFTGPLCEIGKS
jgi:hypothetical protein